MQSLSTVCHFYAALSDGNYFLPFAFIWYQQLPPQLIDSKSCRYKTMNRSTGVVQ